MNILQQPFFNHQVEITRGVMEEECSEMLKEFFSQLRVRLKEEKNLKTEDTQTTLGRR